MKFRWQLALAGLLLLVSIPLLVWGFWPPHRETRTVPLLPAVGMPNLPEAHSIQLEFAPAMRAGDSQIVKLTLSADDGASVDGFYNRYNVIAEARLEMPMADVRPADIVRTALVEGGSATFYWEVRPRAEGTLRGTAWLYLQLTPKAGGEAIRQPVSAQLAEIHSQSMLGRTGEEARIIGVIGSLVGLAAGILFVRSRRL